MKIGVLGTGWIVHPVTKTLKGMNNMECYAIASRTKERAEQAAKEFGYQVGYGSYEELKKAGATYIVNTTKEIDELL